MYTSSRLTSLFLLFLSLFHTTVLAGAAAQVYSPGPILSERQDAAADPAAPVAVSTGSNAPECLLYARTANLSTVGTNSTYRATFLQMSPIGAIHNARMFTAAMDALPSMTADAQLNTLCGNWTTIALAEAEKNFTQAKVLEFNDVIQDAQVIKAGPELIGIIICVLAVFFGVWCFMP